MINLSEIKTLGQLIEAASKAYDEKIAFKFRPRFRAVSFTYGESYHLAQAAAKILEEAGLKKGERVVALIKVRTSSTTRGHSQDGRFYSILSQMSAFIPLRRTWFCVVK